LTAETRPGRIVAIVGPTASGKSDLAIAVARRFHGEVVSCDSVQVYRGLDIGSGKPSFEDRRLVRHHLIDILDLTEAMNAGVFAEAAGEAIAETIRRGRLPIVTGGTGLYLTALLKGLFDQGGADPAIRARLDAIADRRGGPRLHRLLASKDPDYAARTKPTDRIRVVRALEVFFALGRPFSVAQKERKPAFSGESLIIGLDPGREELRRRVTARVTRMLDEGLVAEAARALGSAGAGAPRPRALGAIGYREVVERLEAGGTDPCGDGELLRAIVNSTMQYAKRQMTYFRRQFEVEWFSRPEDALDRVGQWIKGGDMDRSIVQNATTEGSLA